jgi:hypothetical protein
MEAVRCNFPANAPLPFKTAGALRFRNQAQFNPVQYLIALAAAIEADGEFDGTSSRRKVSS